MVSIDKLKKNKYHKIITFKLFYINTILTFNINLLVFAIKTNSTYHNINIELSIGTYSEPLIYQLNILPKLILCNSIIII